jgi:DNA-binding PadR family transcriptional regulator
VVPKRPVPRSLTTPDLVVLSLLAERAMHGYEVSAELERRQVRDWAALSRPQVYYSLEKLDRLGLIRAAASAAPPAGPERRVFSTTAAGIVALADALERDGWTTERERPPFLTWMALSWQARPGVFARQLRKRRAFLERELVREQETLAGVRREVGHEFHEAVWMIKLTIRQIRAELRWIARVEGEFPQRALARHVPPTDG